jgi:DNA-binding NarL/FixJ family response regulator
MDIRLPGENGIEVTKKVKAQYPDITVIILTGYDIPEYRQFSSRYADYFFSKDAATAESIFTVIESLSLNLNVAKKTSKASPPPSPPRRCEKIGSRHFRVIPAKAGIQYFQAVKNFLDPGFHRGD